MLQLQRSFSLETSSHLLINLGALTTDTLQCVEKGLEPVQVLQDCDWWILGEATASKFDLPGFHRAS